MLEDHYHGARYVDLSMLESKQDVYQAVAHAMDVHESSDMPLETAVLDKLRPMEMLLVFDNVDAVMEEAGPMIAKVVDFCPQIQVITTSRKQLTIPNVHHFPVTPMASPPEGGIRNAVELSRLDSVALFMNRANLLNEEFELTDHNAPLIGAICSKLEGIPLAIELAAAKTGHMDLAKIAANLEDRFSLLIKSKRNKGQPALETAIRWSFDGLNEKQQILLLRLCMFAGDFTYESALKVAGWAPLAESEVGALLRELIDQCYLVPSESYGTRYLQLLDTIRDFGRGIVVQRGWTTEYMNRHSCYFVDRANEISCEIYGPDQVSVIDEVHRTYRNYIVSLNWSVGVSGCDHPQQLVRALYIYWHHKSMYGEGVRWAEEILKDTRLEPIARAKVHIIAGTLASFAGGYAPADHHFSKALRIGRRQGNLSLIMRAYASAGTNHGFAGDLKKAIASVEKALEVARQLGDELDIADFENNLGIVLVEDQKHEAARAHLLASLSINTKLGRIDGTACNNYCLGRSYRLSGELDAASAHLEAALKDFFLVDDSREIAATIRELAFLRMKAGAFFPAAVLFGADDNIRRAKNIQVSVGRRSEVEKALETLRTELRSQFLAEFERGRQMSPLQIREFLLLGDLGIPLA